jgi:hypothetical protein
MLSAVTAKFNAQRLMLVSKADHSWSQGAADRGAKRGDERFARTTIIKSCDVYRARVRS